MKALFYLLIYLLFFFCCIPTASSQYKTIEELRDAIIKNPNDGILHHSLGYAYSNLGQTEKAITEYKVAVRIDPKKIAFYMDLGNLYYDLGQNENAILILKQGIKANKIFSKQYKPIVRELSLLFVGWMHETLGRAFLSLGHYQEAINEFEKENQISPEGASTNFNLGISYDKIGDGAKAIVFMEKAKKLYKKNYLKGRGILVSELKKNYDETKELLELWEKDPPKKNEPEAEHRFFNSMRSSLTKQIKEIELELEKLKTEAKINIAQTNKYLRFLYKKYGYEKEDFDFQNEQSRNTKP